MLRTPKNPARHMANCTCRGCSHPDVQFFRALNRPRHTHDQWQAVDLSRPARQPVEPQPERPTQDFAADMASLLDRIRGER